MGVTRNSDFLQRERGVQVHLLPPLTKMRLNPNEVG
jgi:hypothetical protein